MKTKKFKIIGAGGIGGWLLEPLARYLNYKEEDDEVELTVIDGDTFEERNMERQKCNGEMENKARHLVKSLAIQFPNVHFRAKKQFVTSKNVIQLIREDDVVFMCVDNHATRKLVCDRCWELNNVLLISGGNEYTDGNVNVYCRKNGKEQQRPITAYQHKIANPEDENPGDLTDEEREGCQEEARSKPQLLFMNLAIASTMLNVYYAHEQGEAYFEQVYVDIVQQKMRPSPEKQPKF
jgi:molybdopterin/thiamine biosynthesis adenylyltransferase